MDRNVSNDIDRGDLRQSLQNILANKVAELTETVNMMDPANLEHILDRLEHARMVQLAAVGNTIPVALDGAFKFNQLGIPATDKTDMINVMPVAYAVSYIFGTAGSAWIMSDIAPRLLGGIE